MRPGQEAHVYIMSNASKTLYIGVTSDLHRRIAQHLTGKGSTFTQRYSFTKLVWFEASPRMDDAIAREKVVKGWLREKKVALVEELNPRWRDLSAGWYE